MKQYSPLLLVATIWLVIVPVGAATVGDTFAANTSDQYNNSVAYWIIADGKLNSSAYDGNFIRQFDTFGAGVYSFNYTPSYPSGIYLEKMFVFGSDSNNSIQSYAVGNKYLLDTTNRTDAVRGPVLYVVIDNVITVLASNYSFSNCYLPGSTYNMTIIFNPANETTIIVFQNGVQMVASTNTSFGEGYAGFQGRRGVAEFDDLFINETAVANFTPSATTILTGESVTFTQDGENWADPNTYLWNFGDGDSTNATEQNPIHTYTTPGTYQVNLTISGVWGSNLSANTEITVLDAIVADFTANQSYCPAPCVVRFLDNSTNTPTTWAWTFSTGDPLTNASQNATVIFRTPGRKTVTLNASHEAGYNISTSTALFVRPRSPYSWPKPAYA
jgi:PKD repeat protein